MKNKKITDYSDSNATPTEYKDLKDLPLLEIFSRDIKLNDSLRYKIDSILDQRLKNEMVISKWLNDGISNADMEVSESDVKLIELHNRSKDSISDLVKIKQLLGGLPTESKAVIHTIDTNAVLDAVRKVREEKVSRQGVCSDR